MESDRGSPYLDDASMYSGVEDDGTVGYNVCKDCMVREVGEQCGGDNGADNYADSDPDSDDESSDNIEMDACPGMDFKGTNGKNGKNGNGKNGNGCKTNGKNGNSKNGKNGKNGKEDYFDCAKFMTNNKKGQKGKGKGPMPICELGGVNRCKPKNGKNGANGKNGSGNGRNGNGRNGRNGNGRNGMGNGKNGGSSCNGDDDDDEAGMNLKKGNKDADCDGKMKDDDDQNCAGACACKECTIDWVYSTGFQNFFCIYKKKYCGKPCAELMKSAQNAYEDLCEFEKEKYRNICL